MLGAERLVHVELDAKPVVTDEVLEVARDVDAAHRAGPARTSAEGAHARAIARFEPDAPSSPARRVELAVDRTKLHFFDLETGAAV